MQTTAINGHPSNAGKSQRVTYIHLTDKEMCHYFGYLFRLFPDFGVSFFGTI